MKSWDTFQNVIHSVISICLVSSVGSLLRECLPKSSQLNYLKNKLWTKRGRRVEFASKPSPSPTFAKPIRLISTSCVEKGGSCRHLGKRNWWKRPLNIGRWWGENVFEEITKNGNRNNISRPCQTLSSSNFCTIFTIYMKIVKARDWWSRGKGKRARVTTSKGEENSTVWVNDLMIHKTYFLSLFDSIKVYEKKVKFSQEIHTSLKRGAGRKQARRKRNISIVNVM